MRSPQTVASIIDQYLTARSRVDMTQGTVRTVRSSLHSFAVHVGQRDIARLGPVHIETWLESMEHLAPATRRARLSTLRAFFAWSVRRNLCRRNPAAEVNGPRQPRTIPRALTAGQIALVLDACPDSRARLIVTLMVQQGLRCIEVSRLELGHIDRTHGTMAICGKGGHERILPLMAETAAVLDEYLTEHPATAGPLIRSYREPSHHLTAQTLSTLVAEWMWTAGIKRARRDGISAHAGRHTCATDMLRNGAHLRDVQSALGHASLTTTEVYLPHVVHGLAAAMGGRTYRTARA